MDFWPKKVAQLYGPKQFWDVFCLDFWPQEVAQQYGSEQLWASCVWISGRRRWRSCTVRSSSGRVVLGFLAAGGGAAVWFRAALGRVMLGFLGSKVRVGRSVESIHVQNC